MLNLYILKSAFQKWKAVLTSRPMLNIDVGVAISATPLQVLTSRPMLNIDDSSLMTNGK